MGRLLAFEFDRSKEEMRESQERLDEPPLGQSKDRA